ncbi:MAG: hypothetical protein ABFD54_16210 [Armatimonadota bacterium]|nr:hypothetical protein [bacterium]
MIKLRVEWRHICSGCGTELVADFFADSAEEMLCPWCGSTCGPPQDACMAEIKEYLSETIKDIEARVNNCAAPTG